MYTLVGKPFADWVDLKVKERHAKVKAEREMQIEMDAELLNIFHASTSVAGRYFPYPSCFAVCGGLIFFSL